MNIKKRQPQTPHQYVTFGSEIMLLAFKSINLRSGNSYGYKICYASFRKYIPVKYHLYATDFIFKIKLKFILLRFK